MRDLAGTPEQQARSKAASQAMVDTNHTRGEIMIDFTLSLLGFCWSLDLNSLKTSTLFSILFQTHQYVSEVPGPAVSVKDGWEYFQNELLRHSIERPPFSIAIFATPEIESISKWVLETYFAQLKMYQYVFGTTNELEIQATNSLAEQVNPHLIGTNVFQCDKPPQEFSLDWAKNYYPHSGFEASGGMMTLPTTKVDTTTGLVDTDGGEDGGEVATSPSTLDGDEFRDDSPPVGVDMRDFLDATSAASRDTLGRVADQAANQMKLDSHDILADPADQALFDAAIARELASLYKEFGTQLSKQQETFSKRLAELETSNGNGVGGLATQRGSGGHQTNGQGQARPSRSRGKA